MTQRPEQEVPVAVHPPGPTPGIVPVLPSVIPRTGHCEIPVHIGLFFDGTGNNKDWNDQDDCHVGSGTQLHSGDMAAILAFGEKLRREQLRGKPGMHNGGRP